MPLWGGVEAGGTKFVCALGEGPDRILAEERFPTETPSVTLKRTVAFFQEQIERFRHISAVGVSAFGPVDPNPNSPTFGHITTTPKPGWANTDIVGFLRRELQVPIGFDTDVNGAALGEFRWGAARGLDTFIYLTIGTGIGGGGLFNGKLMHGLVHPEMGHLRIPHNIQTDPFPGCCPYHGDCWEGLASGTAIESRWGKPAATLPEDHPAWDLEAEYLALALQNLVVTLSPQRIIMGGGVMQQKHLFPRIHRRVQALLNNYVQHLGITQLIAEYIVPPALGNRSGVLGGFALAEAAFNNENGAGNTPV